MEVTSDSDFRLFHGDVLEVLATLEPGSVDCVITSPPYWGLRDYSVEGQIGLEASPDEFVARMVEVFRAVRRVLADHGTVWLNLGDSYASSPPGNVEGVGKTSGLNGANDANGRYRETLKAGHATKRSTIVGGLKPKDLCMIPARVAIALQADGWYLRSDIVWSKPNPMPESCTDRPTSSHEHVFLLAKQPRYWFDQEAVRERLADANAQRTTDYYDTAGRGPRDGGNGGLDALAARMRNGDHAGRNIRNVWTIATQPYSEAHFATFPQELVRRCLLAGCPIEVCRVCGKPRERIVERIGGPQGDHTAGAESDGADEAVRATGRSSRASGSVLSDRYREHGYAEMRSVGWSDCGHGDYRPGRVLDPFMGSGTTALVARNHGRHSIGIELNPDYCVLAAERLKQLSLFG